MGLLILGHYLKGETGLCDKGQGGCDILVLDNHKSRSKDVLNYSAFFTTLLSDFIQAFAPIHLPGLSSRLDFVSFPSLPLFHLLFALSTPYVLEVQCIFLFFFILFNLMIQRAMTMVLFEEPSKRTLANAMAHLRKMSIS